MKEKKLRDSSGNWVALHFRPFCHQYAPLGRFYRLSALFSALFAPSTLLAPSALLALPVLFTLFVLLALSSLLGCSLAAQPPASIMTIDQGLYPEIRLRVATRSPHANLSFIKPNEEIEFKVEEIYREKRYNIEFLNIKDLQLEAERLNVVLLIDTTQSVSRSSFRKFIENARFIINTLRPEDRMAIYSVKDRPTLLTDLSGDHKQLLQVLEILRQDGKITRLYDALYSGIYTARSIHESEEEAAAEAGKTGARTITLLMTDGREESSYLNDEDCLELTKLGQQLHIPLYVLLSSVTGNSSAGYGAGNHRLLRRLTFKTGGSLYADPNFQVLAKLLNRWRRFPQSIYEISYVSPVSQEAFPGEKVEVRLTLQAGEGEYAALSSYRLSWLSYPYVKSNLTILWPALAFIAVGLFLLLFFLLFRRHRYSKRGLPRKWAEQPRPLVAEEAAAYPRYRYGQGSDGQDRYSAAGGQMLPATGGEQQNGDLGDFHPERQASYRPISVSEAGLLMEDERLLYMRQYGYRMLQLALRNARPYRHAALVTEKAPRKRTYDLFLDNTLIGSGRWAHVPIYDTTVSPVHARIRKVNDRYIIYDLLSAAGIYLNDRKLLRPRALRHGDHLRIGRSHFIFEGRQ